MILDPTYSFNGYRRARSGRRASRPNPQQEIRALNRQIKELQALRARTRNSIARSLMAVLEHGARRRLRELQSDAAPPPPQL